MTNDELQAVIDDLDYARNFFPEEGEELDGRDVRRSLRIASTILCTLPDELVRDLPDELPVQVQATDGECHDCLNNEAALEPCPKHRRVIHESWHKAGLWWVRREECHAGCPGLAEGKKHA